MHFSFSLVSNKRQLVESGLAEVAVQIIVNTNRLPIQFKAVAILRLLAQDNGKYHCTKKEVFHEGFLQ